MKQFLLAVGAVTASAILLCKLFDEIMKEKEKEKAKST